MLSVMRPIRGYRLVFWELPSAPHEVIDIFVLLWPSVEKVHYRYRVLSSNQTGRTSSLWLRVNHVVREPKCSGGEHVQGLGFRVESLGV